MKEFTYTNAAQQVVFGAGAVGQLSDIADQFGWQRILLCTTEHLRANGTVEAVASGLGNKLVATYEEVQPHVPDFQVDAATDLADKHSVDAVIGLGGGSPIGMAKAVAHALEQRRTGKTGVTVASPMQQPLFAVIAIPTTYAGSDMTPIYGVTRTEADGSTRKVTARGITITPKLTLYDPLLTVNLPPDLTASTGINALAHCVEAVYSKQRNPVSTAVALRGINYITRSLVRCYEQGDDLDARTNMLMGAHLGGVSLATVSMGIHHGTGHVLGGTAGVPHGVANCIVLPHAIRFNATTLADLLALAAETTTLVRGDQPDYEFALTFANFCYDLIAQLKQPQRLRDVGVDRSLLPKLAENMLKSTSVKDNPKPLESIEQAQQFLESMW